MPASYFTVLVQWYMWKEKESTTVILVGERFELQRKFFFKS